MRSGLTFGISAYLIWGLFPLYWPLLEPAGSAEILAHRMVWSLAVMALVVAVRRHWSQVRAVHRRTWLLVATGSVLISVNWGVYIYAVNNGQVLDAALGYFINPLVSVLLGVLIFHEKLRVPQWISVALGATAVVVIAAGGAHVPWVSLVLAASFALYGLVKKVVPLPPETSLTAEGLVLIVPALTFLTVLQLRGQSTLTGHGFGHDLLLAGAGLVTVVPLLAFSAAARALPLTIMGLLQYLTPLVQFLLGVLWAHEHMPTARWVGFVFIWAALALLCADGLRAARAASAGAPTTLTASSGVPNSGTTARAPTV